MHSEVRRGRLAAEILAAYLRAWRELRRAPITTVVERLRGSQAPTRTEGRTALEEARRLGHIVVRALALVPGDTRCLRRSLVLMQLMDRRGISAQLVIGTRTSPDFLAHAWIEHDGEPVLSPGDGSFGRLVEL
ncbi:MAG: lasso peptide biosynthesis B2 protein [Solirubrobacterales bacterium]